MWFLISLNKRQIFTSKCSTLIFRSIVELEEMAETLKPGKSQSTLSQGCAGSEPAALVRSIACCRVSSRPCAVRWPVFCRGTAWLWWRRVALVALLGNERDRPCPAKRWGQQLSHRDGASAAAWPGGSEPWFLIYKRRVGDSRSLGHCEEDLPGTHEALRQRRTRANSSSSPEPLQAGG